FAASSAIRASNCAAGRAWIPQRAPGTVGRAAWHANLARCVHRVHVPSTVQQGPTNAPGAAWTWRPTRPTAGHATQDAWRRPTLSHYVAPEPVGSCAARGSTSVPEAASTLR